MNLPTTTPQITSSAPLLKLKGRIRRVLRHQGSSATPAIEPLDQPFAVQESHHDVPMHGGDAAIHDQDVPVEDFGTLHRVTLNGKKERRDRVAHQVLVDVQPPIRVVLGRGGEARGDGREPQWPSLFEGIQEGKPVLRKVLGHRNKRGGHTSESAQNRKL